MSRSRRALAALTMAAAVGGALLTAGCGATPAGPADAINPSHPGLPVGFASQQRQSMTANLVNKGGLNQNSPASITCTLIVNPPSQGGNQVHASVDVACTSRVTEVDLNEELLQTDPTDVSVGTAHDNGQTGAHAAIDAACEMNAYLNNANATVVFPNGYEVADGSPGSLSRGALAVLDCS
jgi:hypothetical protein